MRFLCSAPTRRLGATGSVVCVLKVCVCVCDYAQYIQLLDAYDELAVFTGLMGATRYS